MNRNRRIGLIAPETQKELHVIPAHVLTVSILLNQGNQKQKGRFQKTSEQGIKWTTLSGGSFCVASFPDSPKPKAFLGGWLSKSWVSPSSISRPKPMKVVQTRAIPVKDEKKNNIFDAYVLLLFPSQWADMEELKLLISKFSPLIRRSSLPLLVLSIGDVIESKTCTVDTELQWASFQAKLNEFGNGFNPNPLQMRFRKISLDSDEIAEALEGSF